MTKDDPAYIACRQSVDGEATKIRIVRAGKKLPSSLDVLSEALGAPAFSEDHDQYFNKEIAPLVSAPARSALQWK